MNATAYQRLVELKRDRLIGFDAAGGRCCLAPDMGGRIFAEIAGTSPNRIDLDCVANPNRPFNNFGGGNLWPAPEGGPFAFNYEGAAWRVQPAINDQPFEVVARSGGAAAIEKRTALVNRAGTRLDVCMRREFSLRDQPPPEAVADLRPKAFLAYETRDTFRVLNRVGIEEALIGAWTLEQFQASEHTVSFCVVANPAAAINFDFYEHPGERIAYYPLGFTYRTDGRKAGQIGVRKDAGARCIGFYDPAQCLLCVRENGGPRDGFYFNIADNAQPGGPYSAADDYSIFNSNADMGAFELETIGCARAEEGRLTGSELVSRTSLAVFDSPSVAERYVSRVLSRP